ncbi:hypothetical protein K2173_016989 [Erythroxylum novogranatense]|uniref:Endosulphine n=1 Tax=Erythroxylum novogranatense TaxID=1862640 RepID=A0AAV8U9N6_9ROSI|nr:hypothetical protein K2173_016989 [Erythroxylum novogranatense]
MSSVKTEEGTVEEREVSFSNQVDEGQSVEAGLKDSAESDESPVSKTQEEEEKVKGRYGELLPKKKPLISKDHERAFFDSADWALGKQGAQKPKGPLEALRPKLELTPHHQVRSRLSDYAAADDDCVDSGSPHMPIEDQTCMLDNTTDEKTAGEEQGNHEKLPIK